MNKDLAAFTGTLGALTILTGVLAVQIATPSFLSLILTVLAAATWFGYVFIQRSSQGNFIRNYLLTIVLKLMAGGIFIFILFHIDKQGSEANAVLFMVTYFLFTGLEVGFLFKRLR